MPMNLQSEKMASYADKWERYLQLMKERPELFVQSDMLEIITDTRTVTEFAEKNQRIIGVIYESRYSLLVVDLVRDQLGNCFAYERLIPQNIGAIVSVPQYNGKFVLLQQYRHALRNVQLSFPRGFGEPGLSAEDNVRKELREEIDADVLSSEHIGSIAPDSGMISSEVDVYYCSVSKPDIIIGNEGIQKYLLLDENELQEMIMKGEITDGFTLSALTLYNAKKKSYTDKP